MKDATHPSAQILESGTETAFSAGVAKPLCLRIVENVRHLRRVLAEWFPHYNHGRPHASLGPGIPDRRSPNGVGECTGHAIRADCRVAGARPRRPSPRVLA